MANRFYKELQLKPHTNQWVSNTIRDYCNQFYKYYIWATQKKEEPLALVTLDHVDEFMACYYLHRKLKQGKRAGLAPKGSEVNKMLAALRWMRVCCVYVYICVYISFFIHPQGYRTILCLPQSIFSLSRPHTLTHGGLLLYLIYS